MRKASIAVCLLLSVALAGGCANIKNDTTRTQTEGTLVGAGGGALLGAGIGAIFGGTKGAAIGAGVGAAAGAAGGFLVGDSIAKKKADYAREEDWYDANIQQAAKVNKETSKYNASLRKEVADLDRRASKLKKDYAKNKAGRDALLAAKSKVDTRSSEVRRNIAALEKEYQNQQAVAVDARRHGSKAEAAKLDREIAKTKKSIAEMKEYNSKLAAISVRLDV